MRKLTDEEVATEEYNEKMAKQMRSRLRSAAVNAQSVDGELSKAEIERKLYGYYRFFHTGSVAISIILLVGWLFYFILGSTSYHTQQYLSQNYANAFDPHWNVFVAAILILIFGRFLSYISAALCKWVENMEK